MALEIGNEGKKPEHILNDVRSFELSANGQKLLARKENDFFIFDALATPPAKLPVVANAITHSAEQYTDFVTNAYQKYLGRNPDAAGQIRGLAIILAAFAEGLGVLAVVVGLLAIFIKPAVA